MLTKLVTRRVISKTNSKFASDDKDEWGGSHSITSRFEDNATTILEHAFLACSSKTNAVDEDTSKSFDVCKLNLENAVPGRVLTVLADECTNAKDDRVSAMHEQVQSLFPIDLKAAKVKNQEDGIKM
ncbi:hypothetical protein BBJ28_00025933, partial [Nothophytophthora sp. Chile5]